MSVPTSHLPPLRLLAILEATTVNAVAKNVLDFCRGLADLNRGAPDLASIVVSIVTFDRATTSKSKTLAPNTFVTTARERGIVVDVVRERFRYDTKVVSALTNLVARRAPDIIATHNVKSHFLLRVSRLHRDRPWVAFHHGYTSTDLKNRAYNQLDRWSLGAADRVVAVCGSLARQLQERGIPAERISVQHNSIGFVLPARTIDIREFRERFAIMNGDRLVLTIGRLSREKGHVDLVLAFAQLRVMYPGIHAKLVIVGEGPERSAIEAVIRTHGLEKDVRLAGYMGDVRPCYAAADVFVLPSRSEGSPYVLLEAMTAGVPLAATAVGGVPEILTNEETALLVTPQDPRSLAIAISRIINDAKLAKRLAANASTLVSSRYSLETYVRSVSTIYRSLVLEKTQRHRQTV
jgi:glycosyltransferase involved in cell wall biosynthesis